MIYLVGNFADDEDHRQVSKEEALALCKELGLKRNLLCIETSAKSGYNVLELFETLTKHLYVVNEERLE